VSDPTRFAEAFVVPRGLRGDRLLVEWVTLRRPVSVAIDAPLSLPHSVTCVAPTCVRCELGVGEYLRRDVDRLAGGMSVVMLAAIAFRGMYLARKLRERSIETIETYPAASYRALGVSTTIEERAAAVAARIDGFSSQDPDQVDAGCAALAAASRVLGSGRVVQRDDGEIWLVA
jgi:predicted nuclease with RNAse H fold